MTFSSPLKACLRPAALLAVLFLAGCQPSEVGTIGAKPEDGAPASAAPAGGPSGREAGDDTPAAPGGRGR